MPDIVNVGSTPNDGNGDPLRVGFQKINAKFTEAISVKDFGAVGNGVADDYQAIRNAIDFATNNRIPSFPSGPSVYFPPGHYFVGQTIDLKKSVKLFGDDSGMAYSSLGARLTFPVGVDGIRVQTVYTEGLGSGANTTGADGTIIQGLQLWGTKTGASAWEYTASGGETAVSGGLSYTVAAEAVYRNGTLLLRNVEYTGSNGTSIVGLAPLSPGDVIRVIPYASNGIWLRGRALIRDCYIRNWLGDGIRIIGDATATGVGRGNANSWRIEGGRTENCDKHGLYLIGADVNAGCCIGLDSSENKGYGIYDSSFLGNTFIATHTAVNLRGSYRADNLNNRSVWLGCYSESGHPGAHMGGRALALGGAYGEAFTQGGQLYSNNGGDLKASSFESVSPNAECRIGGEPENSTLIRMQSQADQSAYRFKWSSGDLIFNRNNGSGILEFTGTSTSKTFGRQSAMPGVMSAPNGFALGAGSAARMFGRINYSTSNVLPTTGYYARGEIWFFPFPDPGGYIGFVVTTAGTAGVDAVFKRFGAVEP